MRNEYGFDIEEVPRQDSDSGIPNNILEVDNKAFGVLVADQVHPHMVLVRERDKTVHLSQLLGRANAWTQPWADSDFVDAETARSHCDNGSLVLLETLRAACNNSAFDDHTDQIHDFSDEEATSIDTTTIFKREERRRQGGTSDLDFSPERSSRNTAGPTSRNLHIESWVNSRWAGNPPDIGKTQSEPIDDRDSSGLPPSNITPTVFTRASQTKRHSK